jgi:hypothetical protein
MIQRQKAHYVFAVRNKLVVRKAVTMMDPQTVLAVCAILTVIFTVVFGSLTLLVSYLHQK